MDHPFSVLIPRFWPRMSKRKSEYEVELVLARRRNFKTRKIEYLVKWKGYTSSENQWVAGKVSLL